MLSSGALKQSRRALPPIATRRLCCEHCGCAMDTRSDFDADLYILTFDIPDDALERAAKMIQNALGIESDDVANYCFPKAWPEDREQRARIIGDWLQTEARYLA